MMISKLFSFIFFLFFISNAFASPAEPIILDNKLSQALLTPHVSFLKETNNSLPIKEIINSKPEAFQPLLKKYINQGFTTDTFWLKLKVYNPSDSDIDWVISHETSYLDNMSVYSKTGTRNWETAYISDHGPFLQRSEPYRKLNFSYITPANETTELFIKLQMINKDALTLGLTIQSKKQFNQTKSNEQFFYGIYFGVILTLIVISLIFALKIKQKLYFTYTLYLFTHLALWGFLTGYVFQYVSPEFPAIFNQGFNIVFLLFFITAIQFSKQFLNTPLYSPLIDKVLIGLQGFATLAILLRLAGVYELIVPISHTLLLSLVLLPFVGWVSYRQGLKYARWYIIAWAIFGFGILLSVLSASTSIFDWGMEPIVYTQVFSLLESFLLMLALADKVNQVNEELINVTHKSQQDPLTRLGNRRLLKYKFNQIMMSAKADKKYWCLVLDIDDFKILNDTYGHVLGDDVLKKLANIFKQFCRPEDLVIRYGGEEFVILIESSDVNIVKYIAERIRMNVESAVIKYKNEDIRTTVSIGISEVNLDTKSPFELSFKNADQALYHVKKAQKNAIAIFQNSEVVPL